MQRLPRNCDIEKTFILNETMDFYDARIQPFIDQQRNQGWTYYIAGHSGSWCKYRVKQILISTYHLNKGRAYFTYVFAHELAHSYAGFEASHGPLFMAQLKRICPSEYQKYEYEYKPQHALNAGLGIDALTINDLI